ncbi:MAG: ABC transporter substrate-binding protein [Actinomycetota bacterium]|nr:ABC transporter substrate-binding protein [Actinomycetota bacterium]
MRRFLRILVVMTILTLVAAACGGTDDTTTDETTTTAAGAETTAAPDETTTTAAPDETTTTAAPQDPVTIQIFYPVAVDAPIAAIMDAYVADFQAESPNITVEPVFSGGYGDVKTAIQTTVEGGGEPPALALMLAADIFDLANSGLIMPLDDLIAADPDAGAMVTDCFPAFLANSRYADGIWGIPFQRSVVLMYYSIDMFAAAGLDAPTSWDELGAAAQALTVENGDSTNWGIQWPSGWPYWTFQPLPIGAGQNIVGDSDTEVFFDYPEVISAVQFYIDLSEKYKATPAGVQGVWATAPTDFASGLTAMIVHSSGSLPGILEQADFEVGVMALPGSTADTYATVVGGGNLYIMDAAPQDQKDAAWKFIKFLSEVERTADFSVQTGYIAARQSAYDTQVMTDYIAETPQAADARDALEFAGAEFSIQNLGEVRNIFHDYLQRAYNGEMAAADAMAAAQVDSDTALEPFK